MINYEKYLLPIILKSNTPLKDSQQRMMSNKFILVEHVEGSNSCPPKATTPLKRFCTMYMHSRTRSPLADRNPTDGQHVYVSPVTLTLQFMRALTAYPSTRNSSILPFLSLSLFHVCIGVLTFARFLSVSFRTELLNTTANLLSWFNVQLYSAWVATGVGQRMEGEKRESHSLGCP